MNPAILILYIVIQILVLTGLGLPVLYIFLFSFAGLFYRQRPYHLHPALHKIVVLIPGYKEDVVIRETLSDALLQDYPKEYSDIVVIADSFQQDTLDFLKTLPIKVIEVRFDKSTKSKALNKAMEQLTEKYDIAVILDADNLMARDFLHKVNASFEHGFIAMQGHRTAKNINTSLAVLDAASEEINNHIFRKGHRVLGLSSAIIGSGMAFRYDLFKDLMATVTAVGGFDKEIELKLLKAGYTIEYLDDAYVYDEKVQQAEVFSNQRRRWLSAQLIYFRRDFISSLKALITKGNIDYFDKTVQFIQPPRVLLLGMVMVFGIIFFLLDWMMDISRIYNYFWPGIFLVCILAFLFSLPGKMYNWKTLKALASLPEGMLLMLGSLLRIKGANKQFIHTRHGETSGDQSNSR
jgi:cellulose synthase/poly-beta-1,6-N-acetylglucosamine synthase-like glycosyltransferase